jgi:hypothetical protein
MVDVQITPVTPYFVLMSYSIESELLTASVSAGVVVDTDFISHITVFARFHVMTKAVSRNGRTWIPVSSSESVTRTDGAVQAGDASFNVLK